LIAIIRRPRLAPLLYAVLLTGMATGQLASFDAFRRALGGYAVFGDAAWPAVVVLVVELAAALGLLASASVPRSIGRAAGLAGLAVAGFWSVLAAQAFARGLELDNCGCFGAYLAQPLRWWVLVEDAYMLVLAWYAAAAAGLPIPTPALRLRRTQEAT
jgi:hypothetical protein